MAVLEQDDYYSHACVFLGKSASEAERRQYAAQMRARDESRKRRKSVVFALAFVGFCVLIAALGASLDNSRQRERERIADLVVEKLREQGR